MIVLLVIAIAVIFVLVLKLMSRPPMPMGGYQRPTVIVEEVPPPMYIEPDPFAQIVGAEIAADLVTDVAMDIGSMFDGGGDPGNFDDGGF